MGTRVWPSVNGSPGPRRHATTRAGHGVELVKVLDFGIAKMLTRGHAYRAGVDMQPEPSNLSMTRPGILVGTIPYMSPEQLNGDPVDHRTHIWAVGIIFFELLAGRHPLAPLSMSALYEMANDELPMPRVGDFVTDIGALGAIVSTEECGNGYVDISSEECDDGLETQYCNDDCTIPWCGDGFINGAAGEECDDGNTADMDGCSHDCVSECMEDETAGYSICWPPVSWYVARDACASMNAHLVIVDDGVENTYVANISSDGKHWIGLSDQDRDGTWLWMDGTSLTYDSWHPTAPNGGTGADCAEINFGVAVYGTT